MHTKDGAPIRLQRVMSDAPRRLDALPRHDGMSLLRVSRVTQLVCHKVAHAESESMRLVHMHATMTTTTMTRRKQNNHPTCARIRTHTRERARAREQARTHTPARPHACTPAPLHTTAHTKAHQRTPAHTCAHLRIHLRTRVYGHICAHLHTTAHTHTHCIEHKLCKGCLSAVLYGMCSDCECMPANDRAHRMCDMAGWVWIVANIPPRIPCSRLQFANHPGKKAHAIFRCGPLGRRMISPPSNFSSVLISAALCGFVSVSAGLADPWTFSTIMRFTLTDYRCLWNLFFQLAGLSVAAPLRFCNRG